MEGARVAVFEDDYFMRETYQYLLKADGHEVVCSAGTMAEARQLIEGLQPGSVHAAIVDGNLSGVINGNDGREIVRLLHQCDPAVATIAMSGDGTIEGAKYQVGKGSILKLTDVLKQL